jgi:putative hemolysin
MFTDLILTGAVLGVLVFLSTIESSYEALSEVSLRLMATEREDSPRRLRFFRELMEHRRRFELILILGTQLSIAAIAILLADVFIDARIGAPLLDAFIASFVAVVLFRQLVPRLLAQNHPEDVLWTLLPPFQFFYRFFSVFVAPVTQLLNRMRKAEPEPTLPEQETEEIQAFIDVGEEAGIIEEAEGELIQSIIEFSDTRVEKIMTARPQIVAIEAAANIADARRLITESKHSRIPVYRDQIDTIEGVVYVRDLLAFCEEEKMSHPVTNCMRPAHFVPESKSVRELLEEMQLERMQIAIVIDEYGGTAGLVTIEDIVEEILGEIEDEDEVRSASHPIRSEDGSYLLSGRAEIKSVEELFSREIEAEDFTTVAGLIISELGRVPAGGEAVDFNGLRFEVIDADSKRVNRVKVRSIEEPSSGGTERPGTA